MSNVLTFDEAKHEYRFGGQVRPSVTQVLQKLHDFGGVPQDVLEAAQERGTAVHLLTQFHDEGDLDPASVGEYGGYLDGWIEFCADHGARWEGIEWRGYSQRYGMAGTMDRYGALKGSKFVIDIKTSAQPHRVWALQLAAYRQLLAENISPLWAASRMGSVQLRPDGKYKFIEWHEPDAWPTFLALIQLTNWVNKQ